MEWSLLTWYSFQISWKMHWLVQRLLGGTSTWTGMHENKQDDTKPIFVIETTREICYSSKPQWTLYGIVWGCSRGHGELSAYTGRQISRTLLVRFSNMSGGGGVIWILEAAGSRYQKQTSASGLFTLITPEGSIVSRLNFYIVVQQYSSLPSPQTLSYTPYLIESPIIMNIFQRIPFEIQPCIKTFRNEARFFFDAEHCSLSETEKQTRNSESD
jgi:hypothetical protein